MSCFGDISYFQLLGAPFSSNLNDSSTAMAFCKMCTFHYYHSIAEFYRE